MTRNHVTVTQNKTPGLERILFLATSVDAARGDGVNAVRFRPTHPSSAVSIHPRPGHSSLAVPRPRENARIVCAAVPSRTQAAPSRLTERARVGAGAMGSQRFCRGEASERREGSKPQRVGERERLEIPAATSPRKSQLLYIHPRARAPSDTAPQL
jgi:hypothetical protein